jgi:ATP-dependent DNA helicase RecG
MSGVQVSRYARAILAKAAAAPTHRRDLLTAAGLAQSPTNYRRHVSPLVAAGLLGLSIPDRPRSPNQRYVLTEAGEQVLAHLEQKAGA